eukprot:CCRYP_011976-RA/>CCRYP_011976-RA protein AED:0.47 eAED:1.00 QI:0/0/0/1/0/0/2/0/68
MWAESMQNTSSTCYKRTTQCPSTGTEDSTYCSISNIPSLPHHKTVPTNHIPRNMGQQPKTPYRLFRTP